MMIMFGLWQYVAQRWKMLELDKASADADTREGPTREERFQYRQARRRQQIGVLTGIAGTAIFAILLMPPRPVLFVIAVLIVVGCLCWTMLIALIDIMSIRLYYGREQRLNAEETNRLQRELQKHLQEGKGQDKK